MTTLIAAYNSEGCTGRCDAKCYEATEPQCTCICGGRNHGAGKKKAIENTREIAAELIEKYRGSEARLEFDKLIQQGELNL